MAPDTINCMILCIHVDKIIIIIPTNANQRQTSVSARYVSKKNIPDLYKVLEPDDLGPEKQKKHF